MSMPPPPPHFDGTKGAIGSSSDADLNPAESGAGGVNHEGGGGGGAGSKRGGVAMPPPPPLFAAPPLRPRATDADGGSGANPGGGVSADGGVDGGVDGGGGAEPKQGGHDDPSVASAPSPSPVPDEAEDSATAAAQRQQEAQQRPSGGGYEEPEWGGLPAADFSLEVLKDGAIVETIDTRGKSHLTLGRTPNNDVVLEHPSSSRLHAVLQFQDGGAEAFLYDAGSTHGTFVNKRQLKPHVHAPVFVGDQLKFGQSSRAFILSGALELMPEEGFSREERRRLRALEKMSEKEAAKEMEAMERAKVR